MAMFRRCSQKINKISVNSGFNQIHNCSVELSWHTVDRHNDSSSKYLLANILYNSYVDLASITSHCFEYPNMQYMVRLSDQIPINESFILIDRLLDYTFSKVKTLKHLHLKEIKLDGITLHILKQNSDIIRTATSVHIEHLHSPLEWTSKELLEFMKLFDNLTGFSISANLKEPILTDEHLSLVSDSVIIESADREKKKQEALHFPEITNGVLDKWCENGVKKVYLGRNSTDLTFSAISKAAMDLGLKMDEQYKGSNMNISNFRTLKYSDEEYRKMLLAQREPNINWSIRKTNKRVDDYKVFGIDDFAYSFSKKGPYEFPNFQDLLVTIQSLRDDTEAVVNYDLRIWFDTFYSLDALEDYKRFRGIHVPEEETTFNRTKMDPEFQEWKEAMLQFFDESVKEIELIIQELEENRLSQ